MSLVEGILQLVEATAEREQAKAVKTIVLEIGRLSALEPEALRFCFESVTRGSIAQDAKLEIIEVPGVAYCLTCCVSVLIETRYGTCPKCGGFELQVTSGTEMRVKAIEILEADT